MAFFMHRSGEPTPKRAPLRKDRTGKGGAAVEWVKLSTQDCHFGNSTMTPSQSCKSKDRVNERYHTATAVYTCTNKVQDSQRKLIHGSSPLLLLYDAIFDCSYSEPSWHPFGH